MFPLLKIDFPERQACNDFSGTYSNLDSDWLAQKISTIMKSDELTGPRYGAYFSTCLGSDPSAIFKNNLLLLGGNHFKSPSKTRLFFI